KRPVAFRDRVVASALEEARRTWMVNGRACFRILAVAGPEDAHLLLDLFVGNARVVSDTALAGDAQLVEDLARALEREATRTTERVREILNDAPVLPRLAGALHSLVDLDHAAFDLCDGAFILFMQAAGQDDVRVTRGVVEKEIDRREELQPFETAGDEGVIWQ